MIERGTFTARGTVMSRPTAEVLAHMAGLMALLPPVPSGEVRLHPDDVEELKRMFPQTPTPTYLTWLGTTVIEDASAPRLPRKAQP